MGLYSMYLHHMNTEIIINMIFSIVGGLGIFLLGMTYMSDGLQNIAGSGLRRLINAVTGNRFLAIGIGALMTMLIQSSSVTTVMTVGFVNSGFMTLSQAIGVIMGANIGTTVTGWILVLKIGVYGLPLLGVSALIYKFATGERIRHFAMTAMGLGMIFFGLELMKNGFTPIKDIPQFMEAFSWFSADTYGGVISCALMGCILTILVQSSSATLGITIGLTVTGVIGFETAAALVLGENIGTTTTAMLASAGASTAARRAAWAHFIFNVLGVLWITALFRPYINFITPFVSVGETVNPVAGVALVHSAFNIMNTLMFLPFIPALSSLLEKMVPDRSVKEPPHLTHLDKRLIETPAIGLEQARVEVLQMGHIIEKMIARLDVVLSSEEPDSEKVRKILHAEEVLDEIQKEMVEFLTDIFSLKLSPVMAVEARKLLRVADELESVSDYAAHLVKFYLKLVNEKDSISEQGRNELAKLIEGSMEYLSFINIAFRERSTTVLRDSKTRTNELITRIKKARSFHMNLISEGKATPLNSIVYTEMLNSFRRINDHLFNIAEALED